MKITAKNSIQMLMLGSLLSCPISSRATVVKDLNQAATTLLGHAPVVTSVYDAQSKNLDSASPASQPWSSSYWPDIIGGIGDHYRDRTTIGNKFAFAVKFWGIADHRTKGDAKNVCEKWNLWNEQDFNKKLSPTEKYDMLLGDSDFTFTKNVLADIDFRRDYRKTSVLNDGSETSTDDQEGDDNTSQFADVNDTYKAFDQTLAYKYWKKKGGSLAYWFGICDGWSPAATTLPRPVNPVEITGIGGRKIIFYPDDLKALADYLYARTNNDYMTTMDYHFAGRPCAAGGEPEKIPDGQPNAGRVKDFRCNDVDAGLWHLALLNRVGMDKMGFVFEIDNNRKINNHPVSSYSLVYFNPATGKDGVLADSVVPLAGLKDAYANRRNPKAVSVVGVRSKFKYLNYQWAEDHKAADWATDDASKDEMKEKEYTYDLELDAAGNILGGEWGNRAQENDTAKDDKGNKILKPKYADQPDFIWMSKPGNLPHSEMSDYTNLGEKIDPNSPAIFGNIKKWAWDGTLENLPADWVNAAKKDEQWQAPVIGTEQSVPGSKVPAVNPPTAKNSILKSAQPLSNIVFYLFDKARDPNQKIGN